MEVDHRSVLPQCLRALPELHYGDASVNPQGPSTGPVVNLPRPERCLLSYRDRPSRQTLLRFCHNGTAWQFTVLPFGLSTSPRVFTKILKPVLAFAHLHRVKLHMYLDDWLLNPGTNQEALEQTSWLKSLCQKLGLVPGPIPTTHQCPGASSHMAWPKSFQPESGECEGCSHV